MSDHYYIKFKEIPLQILNNSRNCPFRFMPSLGSQITSSYTNNAFMRNEYSITGSEDRFGFLFGGKVTLMTISKEYGPAERKRSVVEKFI